MTHKELMKYVESIGFTKNSRRLTFDNNACMTDCFWYTADGMSNYALKIEDDFVLIWTYPCINRDDDGNEIDCAYTCNEKFTLTSQNDDIIKDTLNKLMDDTIDTLREFRKKQKEQRIKAIREE